MIVIIFFLTIGNRPQNPPLRARTWTPWLPRMVRGLKEVTALPTMLEEEGVLGGQGRDPEMKPVAAGLYQVLAPVWVSDVNTVSVFERVSSLYVWKCAWRQVRVFEVCG
jgi:hypothetical protein